jgi:EAL domain-containing protein (putative c-di-GMP-specific phosphodiesterase class I)
VTSVSGQTLGEAAALNVAVPKYDQAMPVECPHEGRITSHFELWVSFESIRLSHQAMTISPLIPKCDDCKGGVQKPMEFSMAFQPIVDVSQGRVYAYEALVRGLQGQGASTVLSQVNEANLYAFDQSCRVEAITLASLLGLANEGAMLAINFLPGAVSSPTACIQLTLKTARSLNFPLDRLIFEITEGEKVRNPKHLESIANEYRKHGFKIAIDDFGAGFANLNLLVDLSVDIVKLDMALIRNLNQRPNALAVVRSIVELCQSLGITLIAEGVETVEEYVLLRDSGILLMQGYLLARPAFERLPGFVVP